MASFSVTATGFPTGSGVKTLSGTTADAATITASRYWMVEILNVGSVAIDYTASGATAVAGAAGTVRIPAGGFHQFHAGYVPEGVLSIVSATTGGDYEVNLLPLS